ncbi:RNI-like protein [Dothidotthia symphoricarpi CBS 119687]|uniref:RNI-like protein n=1 Tax=Dothidotthia symphoricarpi CBS 119687 TaxID=1392245 RepID=A0A6A6AE72_9PLEO|nr:RNI-like protein [Dothidotthia symphoricarpi CBS 119687]KAF2129207.1 RNI-like protein [Dothidotthia symphoricarpi CBS 119687]
MIPSSATEWAVELQHQLYLLSPLAKTEEQHPAFIDEIVLKAPRRKAADPDAARLAKQISRLMYPAYDEDSLGLFIKYEKDIVRLRKMVILQRKRIIDENTKRNELINWAPRIRKQGPWNPATDAVSLEGAPSLPMPVDIADPKSLAPFFDHLALGGNESKDSSIRGIDVGLEAEEPGYSTSLLEFEKGVVYSDQRMDLCKMVLGPNNIGALMESLKPNHFITHFLLGNNIIGPHGAHCIADFLKEYPNRMDTWYLAGNCIDTPSFRLLVDEWVKSTVVTNIWLKRNPLGPAAADDVFRLITQTENLRTLDLDQTELGDVGVAKLFTLLAHYDKPVALRHIYLNAVGIGAKGAGAIADFLASPHCALDALYASNNPLGNDGLVALATGMRKNNSLTRLTLSSVGAGDVGVVALCHSLHGHNLKVLDLDQSYATKDLGARFNWITDASASALASLTSHTTLSYLNLGQCALTHAGLTPILSQVLSSPLLFFAASTIFPQARDAPSIHAGQRHAKAAELARAHILRNIQAKYGAECSYTTFRNEYKRWLVNDKTDVRKIDSVYRNRDAGQARRGGKKLVKWWEEGDETLERVMGAVGPVCVSRRAKEGLEGVVGPTRFVPLTGRKTSDRTVGGLDAKRSRSAVAASRSWFDWGFGDDMDAGRERVFARVVRFETPAGALTVAGRLMWRLKTTAGFFDIVVEGLGCFGGEMASVLCSTKPESSLSSAAGSESEAWSKSALIALSRSSRWCLIWPGPAAVASPSTPARAAAMLLLMVLWRASSRGPEGYCVGMLEHSLVRLLTSRAKCGQDGWAAKSSLRASESGSLFHFAKSARVAVTLSLVKEARGIVIVLTKAYCAVAQGTKVTKT